MPDAALVGLERNSVVAAVDDTDGAADREKQNGDGCDGHMGGSMCELS